MKISLVIPCYNEETNIQKGVLDKIGNYTKNDPRFSEIIIVDDGSNDNSRKIIEDKYLNQFPKFHIVKNRHYGKALAVIAGIKKAQSEFTMFLDIDLATPIEESEKLIEAIKKGCDIAIGSRSGQRKGAPLTRKIMALGMIFFRHYLIGLRNVYDTQCGFKIFNTIAAKKIIDSLLVFKSKNETIGSYVSAGFDLEFLFLANKFKYKIKEIPVIWRHVETKNVTFLRSSFESFHDILLIKWYDILKKYPN